MQARSWKRGEPWSRCKLAFEAEIQGKGVGVDRDLMGKLRKWMQPRSWKRGQRPRVGARGHLRQNSKRRVWGGWGWTLIQWEVEKLDGSKELKMGERHGVVASLHL